ncbi:MAG: hypothetical protein AAFW73_13380 [Bacteroidota bacterium]
MQDFNVLTLEEELSSEELELVVAAFSELYHRLTFKHHRRLKLKVVCGVDRAEWVMTLARNAKVGSSLELVPNNDFVRNDWSAQDASILFLPTHKRAGKITREALSQGVPVVSFQNESIAEYVDQSCGMLVRSRNRSQDIDAFSRILSMLYFDPEVRKLLKKGALVKYREISGFATRRRSWSYS